MAVTQVERIAQLEVLIQHVRTEQAETTAKIDELLAMRNKGLGAFWLASTLLGTGMVGVIVELISWIKHP